MDPETDVSSSARVRKRDCDDDDDYDSDDTVESSSPRRHCINFCKEPHDYDFVRGIPLRDVLSITIRPSIEFNKPTVKIYGAVRVYDGGRMGDYLFKREKKDALEFDCQNIISLPLQDPVNLDFFDDDNAEFTLIFLLMFDDDTIFFEERKRYRRNVMESRDLFADEDIDNVGCGIYYISRYNPTYNGHVSLINLPLPFQYASKIRLEKVHSVDVKMVFMESGSLAMLNFKSYTSGKFYGKITARLCLLNEGNSMVLFEKNQSEAVLVDAQDGIPLSRSMVAIGCGSCLFIDVQLHEVPHGNIVVSRTIKFNPGDVHNQYSWPRFGDTDLFRANIVWSTRIQNRNARKQMEMELAKCSVR